MKFRILLMILVVLILVGCKKETTEQNIVENLSGGGEVQENVSTEVTEPVANETTEEEETVAANETAEENETDTQALIEQLWNTSKEEEETPAEKPVSGIKEVTIHNFIGDPEDFSITAGTTVRWTNLMYNYQQIIIILPKNEDGSYSSHWINDLVEINTNESYEYIFNETGTFKWGSKTKFDKIQGIITVS
jgi:plastocyanin